MKLRYLVVAIALATASGAAQAAPVTFTKLTGITGGTPAATGVYRADLSGLGLASIQGISIQDNSVGLGGAGGQFSGFDLDSIILSNTNCADAACAAGLAGGLGGLFDYGNALFTPGAQRAPVDPKLFGTGPAGNTVDNAVATLGAFDGNATTAIPGAGGFLSLGDGGRLIFNLLSSVSTSGLYLYIGEVGDNGEVAAGAIDVSENQIVPEPSALALIGMVLLSLFGFAMMRQRAGV